MILKRSMRAPLFAVGICLLVAGAGAAHGAPIDFASQVEPLLKEHCFKCHSHTADKIKGGLVLDSRAGLLAGGDSGPAIVVGNPDASLLVKVIRGDDPDLRMPPKGPALPAAAVAVIQTWIREGAAWTGGSTSLATTNNHSDRARNWWAIQPLQSAAPPAAGVGGPGGTSVRNPIDAFIQARLAVEGLRPAPEAPRAVLIRRLYWDLLGLPPTPEAVNRFADDSRPDAYELLVDSLLAHPAYGERWARHWLDLVRYADSDGYRVDDYRPHAWRYRDYVVASLNADKPYPQFVQEQLAGDELWPENVGARTATGFLRHWIYEYNNRDVRSQWSTILNDITDTTGELFLGLGLGCARCHDHKFDPITQKDYFRFQAFFTPLLPRDDLPLATAAEQAAYRSALARWEEVTASIRSKIEAIEAPHRIAAGESAVEKFPEDIQALLRKPAPTRTPAEHQLAELAYRQVTYEHNRFQTRIKGTERLQWEALKERLSAHDKLRPVPPPPGITITDVGSVPPPTLLPKGRGEVEPGFPAVVDAGPVRIAPPPSPAQQSTGRRTALARWITADTNALALRVIANRIWQYHFGRGLSPSSSDFGALGEPPSHPGLLDWLATRLVHEGGSLKALHRSILTSHTYRQESRVKDATLAAARLKDPENRLLWRMNSRRLDAEQIRDALLSVSGERVDQAGGPGTDASSPRRTLYVRVMRNTRDPLLDVFDAPEGFTSTAQRNSTTTPSQALLMMNHPAVAARARAFAHRLETEAGPGSPDETRISLAYRLAFSRPPTPEETALATRFLHHQASRIRPQAPEPRPITRPTEKMPYREGRAVVFSPNPTRSGFETAKSVELGDTGWSAEGFVLLKSTPAPNQHRTFMRLGSADGKPTVWFGVSAGATTGSAPALTLSLPFQPDEAEPQSETVTSHIRIEPNRAYFIACACAPGPQPTVTFYCKDLGNDDEPLQSETLPLPKRHWTRLEGGLRVGADGTHGDGAWDGLLDDVRLTSVPLKPEQLLLTTETMHPRTVGFWRLDPGANQHLDASPKGNHFQVQLAPPEPAPSPRTAALRDLCHVLMNSSEFLTID